MGSDNDEKKKSSKVTNSHRSNSHRGSNHRSSNQIRHSNSQPFEGSNPLMKGFYYTYNSEQQSVDQYQSTTEKLIEIVCSAYKEPALLKACLKSLNMQTILEPELQTSGKDNSTTKKDELKFNIQFKEHQFRTTNLSESLSKSFTTIHGQCNRAMKAKIEEDPKWHSIDNNCDPVGLLTIIKAIAHNNESQRNPTVSLIQAEKRLMTMVQQDNQSNDAYRLKFENQADVIQTMGGQLYRDSTLDIVANDTYNKSYDNLSIAQRVKARAQATELWKATLFITNSNQKKFEQLKKQLHNDYIGGDKNSYPTTFNDAYNRLNQYKTFGNITMTHATEGMAFAQKGGDNNNNNNTYLGNSTRDAKGKVIPFQEWVKDKACTECGKVGHINKDCPVFIARMKARNSPTSDIDKSSDSDSSGSSPKRTRKSSKTKKDTKKDTKKGTKKAFTQFQKDLTDYTTEAFSQFIESNSDNDQTDSDESSANSYGVHFLQVDTIQASINSMQEQIKHLQSSAHKQRGRPSRKHRSVRVPSPKNRSVGSSSASNSSHNTDDSHDDSHTPPATSWVEVVRHGRGFQM